MKRKRKKDKIWKQRRSGGNGVNANGGGRLVCKREGRREGWRLWVIVIKTGREKRREGKRIKRKYGRKRKRLKRGERLEKERKHEE